MNVTKFTQLNLAQSFVNRLEKLHIIVMGDDGYYWVAPMKLGVKLINQGYEEA